MTFEIQFNSNPVVTNINLRKEGAEHDILAVDVSVKGECSGKVAGTLLGCSDADARKLLWHEDIEGIPSRLSGVTTISCWAKFDNCTAKIGKMDFVGVTAKKFKVSPAGGGNLDIAFQIGISKIPDNLVGRLGELVMDHTPITIRGEEDLFDEDEPNDDADTGNWVEPENNVSEIGQEAQA